MVPPSPHTPCSRPVTVPAGRPGGPRGSRGGDPASSRMHGFLQTPPPCSIPRQGWALQASGTLPEPRSAASQPTNLVGSGAVLQEEPEPVAGPLVVLQPLAQAPVVILHEAPVQDDLQLACREGVSASRALTGASHPTQPLCCHAWKRSHRTGGSQGAPGDSRTGTPCAQPAAPSSPASPARAAPALRQDPRGTAPRSQQGRLTAAEAGDPQRLGCVQRQAALRVLDVGHGRHGVEVGLQRQLPLVPAGLDLPRDRGQWLQVAPAVPGGRTLSPQGRLLSLPRLLDTWKPLRSVKKVSSLSISVLKRRASSLLMWSRMSTRQDTSRDRPSTPAGRQ